MIKDFDKIVTEKVYKKCVDAGYTTYAELSSLIDTGLSFTKSVFCLHTKKLNLYHLMHLAYALSCEVREFLPTLEDYLKIYPQGKDEYFYFLQSIKEKNEYDE